MLGQGEHETDTKNRPLMNSAFELTNPLEMVKNQLRLLNRSTLMSELGVRPKLRFGAQMSTKQTQKIWQKQFSFWAHESLRNGKKNISGFGIAQIWCLSLARPKLRFWAKMSKKRTRKIRLQRIQLLSSRTLRHGKKTFQAFESFNFEVRASC